MEREKGLWFFLKLLYFCIGVAREGLNLNRGVASHVCMQDFFVPEAGLEKLEPMLGVFVALQQKWD